ncbi:hypothetical protein TL16_g08262 [Triparma laevis f. inornata]|uniref:RWD domain-containing protein n=1 Tax=Triparma laevis f. inornata TaxID=1714386 RepID=A0A9W7EIC4_9STRA|nr:hypothetical protein TL16_g08262 [Triparma laevis f. inornata]
MDYAEEQEMEFEALESIFLSDFVKIDTSHVTIKLIPLQGEGDDVNFVGVTLDVVLPETYPEVVPQIDVVLDKGLALDQKPVLTSIVTETCTENEGMPVLFTVAEAIREWLAEHNVEGQDDGSMYAQMMRREADKKAMEKEKVKVQYEEQNSKVEITEAEKEEALLLQKRKEGTPCTAPNFLAWKEKFDLEIKETKERELEEISKEASKAEAVKREAEEERLTGFEIFSSKTGGVVDMKVSRGGERRAKRGCVGGVSE